MTMTVPVDPSNAAQLRAWDGDEGSYWAAHADHFERALTAYHDAFFATAAIEETDRVLDVGCGTGHATRRAARIARSGSAVGLDLSSAMLAVARQRARDEGLANVEFAQADAQIHAFDSTSFDVAIGQTSAMFFGDRVAALANIGRALRPGGRLVLLTWQPLSENEWIREFTTAMAAGRDLPAPPAGAPGPFTLAEPRVIRSVLSAAGYRDVRLQAHNEPMWVGGDADDAYQLVSGLMGWMLDGLDDAGRTNALDALRETIAAHETPDGVLYESATWIIGGTCP
jgi:ubiquinone/menaquinone biosynthesis C-methylase UbiE